MQDEFVNQHSRSLPLTRGFLLGFAILSTSSLMSHAGRHQNKYDGSVLFTQDKLAHTSGPKCTTQLRRFDLPDLGVILASKAQVPCLAVCISPCYLVSSSDRIIERLEYGELHAYSSARDEASEWRTISEAIKLPNGCSPQKFMMASISRRSCYSSSFNSTEHHPF